MGKKKILILGGTSFIGRNLVEHLLLRNDIELTLFNRQKTDSELFPTVQKIKGDRETSDIQQISKENWDVVIDVSCYYPESLRLVLTHLNSKPQKYIFVSTCSVYDAEKNKSPLKSENTPTLPCTQEQSTDRTISTYGNRKAECERILQQSGLDITIFRPALVYGKYDPTDRFYYWLYQIQKKDTLLLPETGKRVFSTTYVMDLVNLITESIYNSSTGIYNATSRVETSIGQLVDSAKLQLKKQPQSINASSEFLKKENIIQWMEMPLWINGDHFTFSNDKVQNDFQFKPTAFDHAVGETLKYYSDQNWPEPTYGISEKVRLYLIAKLTE